MNFKVRILGSGAAIPTSDRNPTAQLIEINGRYVLIDCAEGTQLQFRRFHLSMQMLSHIFISHLHGDHYFGLIGLLTSLHLLGRKKAIDLYGPEPLEEIITTQLLHSNTQLVYPLHFHPVYNYKKELICEDELMMVHSFPLKHSVPTTGFRITEKYNLRNINKDFVTEKQLKWDVIRRIKNGEDYIDEKGQVYRNEDITTQLHKPRSYSYCSDTDFDESIIPAVKGTDVLYHEATFDQSKVDNARSKMHTTAMEAAIIAKKADVGKLIIGHFSARYSTVDSLLAEARSIFPETYAAEDGLIIEI